MKDRLRRHWLLLGVLGAYAVSAFLVPVLAPVSVSDDPLYARSVQILVEHGNFRILPISVATLVSQVWWGALFATVFHDTLGVLRVATVCLVFLGAIAVYGLCRELRVPTGRSALGTALYLFHPLSYVLGFTFMTDAYLTSFIAIATYCFARALRAEAINPRWLLAGSAVSGLAFLVRQQGALVPVAVIGYLLLARRVRADRAGARIAVAVLGLPALTAGGYWLWFKFLHGTEGSAQVSVAGGIGDAGAGELGLLARRLLFITAVYAAFLVFPVVLGAVGRLPEIVRSTTRGGWIFVGVWVLVLVSGPVFSGFLRHARMPYLQQFVGPAGLGPSGDVRGGRVPFYSPTGSYWITVACVATSVLLALTLAHRVPNLGRLAESPAAMVATVLVVQFLGLVVTSIPLRGTAISRDRYLLPLLPLLIALTLWACNQVRIAMWAAWAMVGVLAAFSVTSTHDFLTYQNAAWSVANRAHARGVPYTSLDAGAAFDAYHLYEQSYKQNAHIDLRAIKASGLKHAFVLSKHDVHPWWIGFYTPIQNNDYIVTAEPLFGYTTLWKVPYSSWLHRGTQYMYLVRRTTLTNPPL